MISSSERVETMIAQRPGQEVGGGLERERERERKGGGLAD